MARSCLKGMTNHKTSLCKSVWISLNQSESAGKEFVQQLKPPGTLWKHWFLSILSMAPRGLALVWNSAPWSPTQCAQCEQVNQSEPLPTVCWQNLTNPNSKRVRREWENALRTVEDRHSRTDISYMCDIICRIVCMKWNEKCTMKSIT